VALPEPSEGPVHETAGTWPGEEPRVVRPAGVAVALVPVCVTAALYGDRARS